MLGSPYLTMDTPEKTVTYPGQAHFAIPGATRTCRECMEWDNLRGRRDQAGLLRPAHCRKAARLSRTPLPEVPHKASECRHFTANPNPPPI
jgi:hypothetical protein